MKNLLIMLSLIVVSSAQSQVWVEDNAIWHYDWSNIAVGGYLVIERNGDSIVEGQQSERYSVTKYEFGDVGPNGPTVLLSAYGPNDTFIYSVGDSVFHWRNNAFRLLYNFGAQIGDSWVIDVDTSQFNPCDDTSRVEVVAAGIENVQGQNYRYIELDRVGGGAYYMDGRHYERFIGGDYMFPQNDYCDTIGIVEFDRYHGLRCFEDDSLSLSFVSQECDYLITHAGTNELWYSRLKVMPNPSSGSIAFSGVEIHSVFASSIDGVEVKRFEVSTNQSIDISELPKGVYILNCTTIDGHVVLKRVVLQ